MKKIIFIVLLLGTVFSSNIIKAQANNQITYMVLLNAAKENFKSIKGESFNTSEDGKKTYYNSLEGFHTNTESITIINENNKQKSYYSIFFNLSKMSNEDMAPVTAIINDAISFANLLVSGGKYKGEDISNAEANQMTTQIRDAVTNNVVMEITSGKIEGSSLFMITFYGTDYWL